eukprot:TRINITY_DN51363_c0_g2_i1.p1 TRINITY_DN51363_c0_g2~~TRINITY_DN51363_c0_g2_i1.p1  ORF type:complete len:279 (-),score=41.47 TRINITY_DN51363_c0_g2_i1:258-1094(-)
MTRRSPAVYPRMQRTRKAVLLAVGFVLAAASASCFVVPWTPGSASAGSAVTVRASHGEVAASAAAAQEPQEAVSPLAWSVEDVRKADFMSSVGYAAALCKSLEDEPSAEEQEQLGERLTAMLQHSDGSRGFFVSYLTNPSLQLIAAERPSGVPEVIKRALSSSDAAVTTPLALMNVMMPTATALQHAAAGNDAQAASSELTARRASAILDCMIRDDAQGSTVLGAVRDVRVEAETYAPGSPDGKTGKWPAFFKRWGYGDEQMTAVRQALDRILAPFSS